jgi:hypothetical protein
MLPLMRDNSALTNIALLLHGLLIALWIATISLVVAGDHLWEGDFTMYYTGFTIIAEGETSGLYDPLLQQQTQQRILDRSVERGRSENRRAYRDGWLPYNYPPHTALLGFWLSELPLDAVLLGWFVIQLLLVGVLIWQLFDMSRHWRPQERLFLITAVGAYLPLLRTLQYGQLSIVVLVVLIACYRSVQHRRDARAGAYWLLGTVKPQLVLMPGIGLLLTRRWRAVTVMFAVGMAWFLATSLWLGFDVWIGFLQMLVRVVGYEGRFGFRPDEMVNFRGLLSSILGHGNAELVNTLSGIFLLAAMLATGLLWWWFVVRAGASNSLAFALSILIGICFSPHLYIQDTLLCILPAVLLYEHLRKDQPKAAAWLGRLCTLSLFAFVIDVFHEKHWNLPRLPQLLLFGFTSWVLVALMRSGRDLSAPGERPDGVDV